jgi:hypothetical protein
MMMVAKEDWEEPTAAAERTREKNNKLIEIGSESINSNNLRLKLLILCDQQKRVRSDLLSAAFFIHIHSSYTSFLLTSQIMKNGLLLFIERD